MNVILARSAGFCWGVQRAVEKARRLARQRAPVYTDGPLIHNEQVMNRLRADGITETGDPASVPGGTLLIRAHGISAERRAMLRKLPLTLADATCPDVAKIQGLIRKHANKGYTTIIYGDPGHAEVIGLLGYTAGRGFVVTAPAEVAALPDLHSVCLCSQSTQFPEDYRAIADAVRRRFPDAVILDTICDSTRNRQAELLKIAQEADAIVVVGSRHSANTLRLVELARRHKPTFHIQTPDEIRAEDFKGFRTVGLTAGASTPDFVIAETRDRLESL